MATKRSSVVLERKVPQEKKVTKQDLKLARQIQKLRKKKGLSQERLAERIGKSTTWVGYVEAGFRIPNLRLLYKIARALDIKVRDLFPF